MNRYGLKINAFKTIVSLSNTLEVKLELRWGRLVLFVLVVMLPSLFSITVIVCTLPPGVIIALESASGIPGRFLSYSSPYCICTLLTHFLVQCSPVWVSLGHVKLVDTVKDAHLGR